MTPSFECYTLLSLPSYQYLLISESHQWAIMYTAQSQPLGTPNQLHTVYPRAHPPKTPKPLPKHTQTHTRTSSS
jgi:hypothetical protein